MGGATGGVWGYDVPALLGPVPCRGHNAIYIVHLRVLQLAAQQKLRNSHSALALGTSASGTVCYDTEHLTYSLAS